MAGSAVVAEVPGEADAMEQTSAEAVTAAEEPMQTECQGELGEEGAVRVIAIDESAAGEEGTILQVHVAMEAQPGQGDQAEVKSPFIYFSALYSTDCIKATHNNQENNRIKDSLFKKNRHLL